MSRIAGFPQGLLDLLDSQNFGRSPNELAEIVSPVVDLTDLYLTSRQVVQLTAGGNVANQSSNLNNCGALVPAGETWLVRAGGGFVTAGAGASCTAWPIISIGGTAVPIGPSVAVPANTVRWVPIQFPDFWLPAGGYLSIYTADVVLVPTASVSLLVNRLSV